MKETIPFRNYLQFIIDRLLLKESHQPRTVYRLEFCCDSSRGSFSWIVVKGKFRRESHNHPLEPTFDYRIVSSAP